MDRNHRVARGPRARPPARGGRTAARRGGALSSRVALQMSEGGVQDLSARHWGRGTPADLA